MQINFNSLIVILCMLFFSTSQATLSEDYTRGSMDDTTNNINDPESSASNAAQVYRAIIKDGKMPNSILTKANCIAVFPKVVSAAIGVGGVHGDGVSFCRTKNGWSNPIFLNLTGASLGLQAGIKSTDVVLYMTNENARSKLQSGSFELSGDLSAVAGSFEENFKIPQSNNIAYIRTKGAFVGAALVGVNISIDEDEQKAFYGSYDRDALFEGRMPAKVSQSVNELKNMLPT